MFFNQKYFTLFPICCVSKSGNMWIYIRTVCIIQWLWTSSQTTKITKTKTIKKIVYLKLFIFPCTFMSKHPNHLSCFRRVVWHGCHCALLSTFQLLHAFIYWLVVFFFSSSPLRLRCFVFVVLVLIYLLQFYGVL